MVQPSYQSLVAENQRLREELAALRDENASLRGGILRFASGSNRRRRRWKRPSARRSGKRRLSPRARPSNCCAHCGSRNLEETSIATQYQTEIPRRPIHRQFDIHIGVCHDGGRTVHGRHELQTSDAVGAAGVQLGPAAHAAMAVLNKELGLSHGKIKRCYPGSAGDLGPLDRP